MTCRLPSSSTPASLLPTSIEVRCRQHVFSKPTRLPPGNVYLRLSDWDAASSNFTAAADLAPGIAGYRLRAATLYYQTGDTARALSTVRGVLRKNPRYPEAHLVMASMLWSEGQRVAAEEEYALATSLDSDLGAGMEDVRRVTLWPPKLYEALARFRSFSS